jgi:hypothetical protein
MAKRIIRITENDITKIVKRVLAEQGGYDDPGVMATHALGAHGGLARMVREIVNMVDQTKEAFEHDIPKEGVMDAITQMTKVLDQMEDGLRRIMPEIMLNDDLKSAAKNLRAAIKKGMAKMRMLADGSQSFGHPMMPQAMGGIGFALSKDDLNDKLTDILMDIGQAGEKLLFELRDEGDQMSRRLMRHGGFG